MAKFSRIRSAISVAMIGLPLVVSSVACDVFDGASGEETAAPEVVRGCIVPDVVGLDQAAAQRQLVDLGIVPVRVDEPSEVVAAGSVISIDPPPGTQLDPCSGEVSLVVSSGTIGDDDLPETPPEATSTLAPTPAAGKSDTYPSQDELPLFLTAFYLETFDDRFFGFGPEWSVDASEDTVEAYTTENGELVIDGYLAAFVGDEFWYDYRVTLGGADYSQATEFHLVVRAQDEENDVWMECYTVDGWLTCEAHPVIDGEVDLSSGFAETEGLCAEGQQQCDISFEAIRSEYKLYVNGEERAAFFDDSFASGAVGFAVDGKWVLDYFHVHEPGTPASAPWTVFRDDFDTAAWIVGEDDGELAVTHYTIDDGVYRWEVEAKAGVTVEQICELQAPFDPEGFPYRFDLTTRASLISGTEGAAYGLLFRCQDYDNLYYYRLEDNGEVDFYALEDAEWYHLAGPVLVDSFVDGGENVLRVVADGARFSFWLNGEFVLEAFDERFDTGDIGLATELLNEGDVGVYEFDNVRVGVLYR